MKVKGKRRNLVGIDLFAGAGGMSLGAQWAGVDVKLAIELNESAFRTYARNHPGTLVLQVDAQDLKNVANSFDPRNVVVFGGPPCQGFSTSNQRTRNRKNDKNYLYRTFIDFVGKLRPGWVVFENVRGILETEGGFFAASVERDLRQLGYDVTSGVLNASNFGVPQIRSRFFLIACREGKAPSLPRPLKKIKAVTVQEAFSDLPPLKNGSSKEIRKYRSEPTSAYANRMRGKMKMCTGHIVSGNSEYVVRRYSHIPQGGNWQDIPAKLMRNYTDRTRCHTGIYKRLRSDEPSVVIGNFRKNMLIHPKQNRGLSVREAARLQSFPDWYVFEGSIGLQQQQVGNAVPPLLAKSVFSAIQKAHREKQ